MNFTAHKVLFGVLLLMVVVAAYSMAQASTAAVTQMIKSAPASSNPQSQIPPDLSPEQIDAHLASMDDVQVRQELAQKLKQEASLKARATASNKPIEGLPSACRRGRCCLEQNRCYLFGGC
jgi:hypothetical protein